MKNLYRTIICLSTVLPISIPFSYIFSEEIQAKFPSFFIGLLGEPLSPVWVIVFAVIALNLFIGRGMVALLRAYENFAGSYPIEVQRAKEMGADSLMMYLPYVLPLFLTQTGAQGPFGWLLGFFLLFSLSWASMTISYSPLLRICGVRFFEVDLLDKRTVVLLVTEADVDPMKIKRAVCVSLFCRIGVK